MTLPSPLAKDLLDRIRGEYLALPGLQLTPSQARRMWALDDRQCVEVLSVLVKSGFLRTTADGRYARAFEGLTLRPRAAKAEFADALSKFTRPAPAVKRA